MNNKLIKTLSRNILTLLLTQIQKEQKPFPRTPVSNYSERSLNPNIKQRLLRPLLSTFYNLPYFADIDWLYLHDTEPANTFHLPPSFKFS